MSKSHHRIVRATAAVIGMSAIGAMGSGTAFAETAPVPDSAPDAAGPTDLDAYQDHLGILQDAAPVDPHSFEMPSLADHSVSSAYPARWHHHGLRSSHHRFHGHHRHEGQHHRHR